MMKLLKKRIKVNSKYCGQCLFLRNIVDEFGNCKLFNCDLKLKENNFIVNFKRCPDCISLLKNI